MVTSRKVAATTKPVAKPAVKAAVKKDRTAKAAPPSATPAKSPTKPTKVATPKSEKKAKPEKIKVVRDSFTIPKSEYAAIADLKKRALALGTEVKKSELIRAGLALLVGSSDTAFSKALSQVPTLKTGRPGKA